MFDVMEQLPLFVDPEDIVTAWSDGYMESVDDSCYVDMEDLYEHKLERAVGYGLLESISEIGVTTPVTVLLTLRSVPTVGNGNHRTVSAHHVGKSWLPVIFDTENVFASDDYTEGRWNLF